MVRFNLNSEEIGLSELSKMVGCATERTPVVPDACVGRTQAPTFLEDLRASGKGNHQAFSIHNLVTERVSAPSTWNGELEVSDLRADLLGSSVAWQLASGFYGRVSGSIPGAEL